MNPQKFQAIARRAVAQHRADMKKPQALNATCQINAQGELLLYGIIGDWWDGLDAKTIVQQLVQANETGPLTVRIHSDGGNIMDGLAIINAMKATGRATHAIVDGVAASMAAYIALSMGKLSMPENAWLMLHKSRIGGNGMTANDLRDSADVLDQFDAMLAKIIADKTGQPLDDVLALIDKDVWINGVDAVAQGYANELLQPIQAAAQLSVANRASAPSALRTLMTDFTPATPATTATTKRGNTMTLEARAKAVGLTRHDNETDEAFLARIEAAEQAQAKAAADEKAKADAIAAAAAARAPPAGLSPDAVAEASAQAITAERNRIRDIRALCATHRIDDATQATLIDNGTSLAEARNQVLDALAKRTAAQLPGGHVSVENNGGDALRIAIGEALMHRFDPTAQLSDGARQFNGYSLLDCARAILGHSVSAGLSKNELAAKALATSDFPALMADVANRTLRRGYDASPRTFTAFARQVQATDFRPINRVQLSDAPALEKVDEAGEYKYGAMSDANTSYKLETFGKIIALTRKVIINDDLDAFTRVPMAFGAAGADLESDTVWGLITGNVKLGDNKTLFHADHHNLGTAGSISGTTLSELRTLLRTQTGLTGKRPLNLQAKFLVAPAALETVAQQMLADIVSTKSGDVNPFAGSLTLIVEPRLDAVSDKAWYLICDPARIDTIEYAYLSGEQGVYIETRQGFHVDGVEIKARLDFGAGVIDYRGMSKNAGV